MMAAMRGRLALSKVLHILPPNQRTRKLKNNIIEYLKESKTSNGILKKY